MKDKNIVDWKLVQTYADLPEILYTKMELRAERDAAFVMVNEELAQELGLSMADFSKKELLFLLAGNESINGIEPIAQAYAGHQFGNFTMLGDGRAILLGEGHSLSGERFDIQLKGAGKTAYSRSGDGLGALGPMLREYIISEAMYGLGIPTSRSLALVTTGEPVFRETILQGAINVRVAASHLRVGTFQYIASVGKLEDLRALADYTIARHDADLVNEVDKYARFLRRVIDRQAKLIALWQAVGFVHGVMNTDNVTISGETIDYGPCAFLDVYDQGTVFSSIDREARYAYGNQPYIGAWNMTRFAESLLPILADDEAAAVKIAEQALGEYEGIFKAYYEEKMRGKLGLFSAEAGDAELISDLLQLLEKYQADYTNTFVGLTTGEFAAGELIVHADVAEWFGRWEKRVLGQMQSAEEISLLMKANNPAVIPRNHQVEKALAAAEQGDYSVAKQFISVLKEPYAYSDAQKSFANVPKSRLPYQTFCGT